MGQGPCSLAFRVSLTVAYRERERAREPTERVNSVRELRKESCEERESRELEKENNRVCEREEGEKERKAEKEIERRRGTDRNEQR